MEMSKEDWNEYVRVQRSGVMNMFGHPLMRALMGPSEAGAASENYSRCREHFDEQGNEEPLEMV